MTVHVTGALSPVVTANLIYVDGSNTGPQTGHEDAPYTTITAALAAAGAGDVITVAPGTYTEDLAIATGRSLKGRGDGLVTVVGTATATDFEGLIEDMSFIDDGAGLAFHLAGTLARTCRMTSCTLTSTATGGAALEMDNTAGTLAMRDCELAGNVANANEVMRVESGTVRINGGRIIHGSAVAESLVCEGDAATTVNVFDCAMQGTLGVEAAAVNPVVRVYDSQITTGAVACATIAGGNTLGIFGSQLTSTDAGNEAMDGAGTVLVSGNDFLGAADGVAAGLTRTEVPSELAKSHPLNMIYVDAAHTGEQHGSESLPYATIAAALAVAVAGDQIHIRPGVYAEDVACVHNVDMIGDCGAGSGDVAITGQVTMNDTSLAFQNIQVTDDGAGRAVHITGANARVIYIGGCRFAMTATGDAALEIDATLAVVSMALSQLTGDAGCANPVILMESGTLDMIQCDILHGLNTSIAMVCQGDAATTVLARACHFQGAVNSEAAAVNPVVRLDECQIVVGAIAAMNIAGGNTVRAKLLSITSTQATQDAVLGAGTLLAITPIAFLGSADEVACTAFTHSLDSRIQHGVVAAAGASPQTDAVTLPQILPTVNYHVLLTFEATGGGADDVVCSVDQGTIAVGGFSVITTSISAAAISGNVHWMILHN